jgi:hypothetical protein
LAEYCGSAPLDLAAPIVNRFGKCKIVDGHLFNALQVVDLWLAPTPAIYYFCGWRTWVARIKQMRAAPGNERNAHRMDLVVHRAMRIPHPFVMGCMPDVLHLALRDSAGLDRLINALFLRRV